MPDKISSGNGEPSHQVKIDLCVMGPGWIAIEGGNPPPEPDQMAHFLCRTLNTWLKENPQVKVRATLPVIRNGNMMAIHIWHD